MSILNRLSQKLLQSYYKYIKIINNTRRVKFYSRKKKQNDSKAKNNYVFSTHKVQCEQGCAGCASTQGPTLYQAPRNIEYSSDYVHGLNKLYA